MARRLRCERGMSLAELLVTMMILGVVSMLVTGTFISLQRTVAASSQRFDDLGQARIALDASTKSMRAAIRLRTDDSPFMIAGPDEVEFFAHIGAPAAGGNERLQRVHLRLVNGELIETITRGDVVLEDDPGDPPNKTRVWQATAAPAQRVIARDIVGDAPIFTYFAQVDDPNDPNYPDAIALPMGGDGGLSADDQRRVRHIGIRVAIQSSTALNVRPTVVANRVHLPNQTFMRDDKAS